MTPKIHCKLLAYSFISWLAFFLVGLPQYYQHWPFWAKLTALPLVTIALFPITAYSLRYFWGDNRYLHNSLWLAAYLTIPIFIYDYILLGIFWGYGIGFVFPFWYLTFFYFSLWIQFPVIGLWMQRNQSDVTTTN